MPHSVHTKPALKLQSLKAVCYVRKVLAETEGFEPSVPLTGYDDLANRCLQPLGHVSGRTWWIARKFPLRNGVFEISTH